MRDILIEFMDSLRDYVAESGTNIAHDERDSSEFVDIFLNQGQSLPIDSVVGSTVWKATMQLRWIKHTEANEPRLGVRFANDIGWRWPDNIVLQQKWINEDGGEKWEDVELFNQP